MRLKVSLSLTVLPGSDGRVSCSTRLPAGWAGTLNLSDERHFNTFDLIILVLFIALFYRKPTVLIDTDSADESAACDLVGMRDGE